MPAFTALGAFVAGAIGLTGTAATIAGVALSWAGVAVASIVAIGASYVASRIIGGSVSGGPDAAVQQGGRIQLPPATNNKIPVLYGRAFMNGIITDARLISTDQKTNNVMYYCLVISETNNVVGSTYTVNDIYWNDLRLVAETSSGNQHKILKGVKKVDGPGEDFEDTNFKKDSNNRVQVRVYAGNSTAAQQVWPLQSTGNTQNAWDFWPNSEWDSTYRIEGLVFAIIRLEYDQETGFTNLAQVTFDLENSVKNPATVWKDYMTSARYGAGLSTLDLNSTAITAWQNYCDEFIRYQDVDTVSTTQKRYEINGPIDTNRNVKDNIDSILRNGGAWMSYDVSDAKWRPIIKKAITAGDPNDISTHFTASISGGVMTVTAFPEGRLEPGQLLVGSGVNAGTTITSQILPLAAGECTGQIGRYNVSGTTTAGSTTMYATATGLLQFSDDNILSGISISSTRLDDLYNSYEVEFFDKYNKDQRAYARNDLPSGLRNPQEPDNRLTFGMDLCNNSVQADLIGNMELRQSRDDLVIEFTASHYGIQAQAGDIIEVYNDVYNWTPKYFRVMRVKETETDDGALLANISALEYNGDVYTVEDINEFTTEANIGIKPQVSSGNLITPDDDGVVVTDININVPIPNIVLAVEIPDGGPYDEIQVWYAVGSTTPGFPAESEYRWLRSSRPPGNEPIFKNSRSIVGVTISGGNTISTATAHNLLPGDTLLFKDATTSGLTFDKQYYVIADGLTSTDFRLALVEGGPAIPLTNGTSLSLDFRTCYPITISTLPANEAGQQYYFRVRVGLRGSYSGFTNPDTAVIPAAEYKPSPVGGGSLDDLSDVTITNPQEGETLYYDATTTQWRNNGILKVNDTTPRIEVAGEIHATGENLKLNTDDTGADVSVWFNSGRYLKWDHDDQRFDLNGNTRVAGEISQTGENLYINVDDTGADVSVWFNSGRSLKWDHDDQNFVLNGTLIIPDTYGLNVDNNTLVVSPSNNRVGINTGNPSSQLEINGGGADPAFITFSNLPDGANQMYGIRGTSTFDDPWFIGAGSTGDDQGYVEIATGDNANGLNNGGQIYVRQYSGESPGTGVPWYGGNGTIQHELILLDNLGHTVIPNNLTVDTNTLFVDSANNRVGVGTLTPAFKLDISGDVRLTGDLQIDGSDIKASNGTICITLVTTGDVLINDDLAVGGDSIILNYDQLGGVASSNASILVERGSTGNDVSIRWNESTDRWQYTVDGTNYINLPNQGLDTTDSPTFAGATLGNVTVGVATDNTISTSSGSLVLDTAANNGVLINDDLNVDSGVLFVDSTNNRVGINDTTPSFSLDVNGDARITTNLTVDAGVLFVDSTNNRVGINNLSPAQALDVTGNVNVTGNIVAGGDLAVNGGDITTTSTTLNIALTADAINMGSATSLTTVKGDLKVDDDINATGAIYAGNNDILIGSSVGYPVSNKSIVMDPVEIEAGSITTNSTATYVVHWDGNICQKYVICVLDTTTGDRHVLEAMCYYHAGSSTSYMTKYAEMYNNVSLATFTVDVFAGGVRLNATPTSSNDMIIKFAATGLY